MINLKETVTGIELGSTRIKAVLTGKDFRPLAEGCFEWENRLIDGFWTYGTDEIYKGLQACFADLKRDVKEKLGVDFTETGAMGISAMMHGYLPFDKDGRQLAAFRTWRNTRQGEAAAVLSEAFGFNIPQRWSVAHVYQAILNKEDHVKDIAMLTTLAGRIHYLLTGENVMGVGEASGMFPIDSETLDYDSEMLIKFDGLSGMPWKLKDILPKVLKAGENAGYLTEEGALLLDPAGEFAAGIPFAPCEGDVGTGMTATNSVREGTGNVSAGTSDFALIVTDKKLRCRRETEIVTTPSGKTVAMIHCNNCTSDINAWVGLLTEFAESAGARISKQEAFEIFFKAALKGKPDCGGLLSYNYYSGEGVSDVDDGRPVFVRKPDAGLSLADFARVQLYSALATLKWGLDILSEEDVKIDILYAHGGFFKTKGSGQTMLSACTGVPVSVMETAGEGGPYGMSLLAAYMLYKEEGESLEDYLDSKVFKDAKVSTLMAGKEDIEGFNTFLAAYKKAFPLEKLAPEVF